MRRMIVASVVAVAAVVPAHAGAARPIGYDLPAAGILLEGIGLDERTGVFYVSGVNDGGNIYRGELGREQLELWVDASGTTGRGIDVDASGRVFVAGGPTGTVRVFDRDGSLLATVATGVSGSFLNDVKVISDGSVLVTDSSLPKIWQVTATGTSWSITEWLDVSGTIAYTPPLSDFDLGGIVATDEFVLFSHQTDLGGIRIRG